MFKKFLFGIFFLGSISSYAQQPITISGKVLFESGKPIEFGTILIPEAKIKTRVSDTGNFQFVLPAPGTYTVQITGPGFKPYSQKTNFTGTQTKNFSVSLAVLKAKAVRIISERDIQKVSRNTLTVEQIKEAPATFGDSLGALATLPGVIRPAGFFGPLIIRGASDKGNRYFIDDIPVPNPQHFGGLQSIISNDLIKEIDLYSSAFPAQFGGAIGAVIDINTIDEVKNFSGVIDVSIISSNFLLKSTWGGNQGGDVKISSVESELEKKYSREVLNAAKLLYPYRKSSSDTNGSEKLRKNPGYWIASGRVGYLSLLVPPIYKLITGKTLTQLPEYYDYQLKGKTFLDNQGKHSLTVLLFGSYDTLKFVRNLSDEEKKKAIEEGQDPLTSGFEISNDISSHSQGVYYEFKSSDKFNNRLILFNSLTYSKFFIDLNSVPPGGNAIGTINVLSKPNIAGIKEKVRLDWWEDYAQLRAALEYNLFYFSAFGQTQQQKNPNLGTGQPDLADGSAFQTVPLNFDDLNHIVSGYIENRFKFSGLTFVPGVRADYLDRAKHTAIGPRGLVAYEFPSETTISAAGGLYHSFPQVNTFLFNQPFNQQPQVIVADYLKPEEALHRTVGLEQRFTSLTSIKIEGFYNEFSKLIESSFSVPGQYFANTGSSISKGIEVLLRKDAEDREAGQLYGWMSYTYTDAKKKLGTVTVPFQFEQPHSLKLVAGYKWGMHNIGSRFEYFSGFPYTPIVGGACSSGYTCTDSTNTRYSPAYDSANAFGSRFPASHRLDLRYTQTRIYKWGSFRWYIEIINVYNYEPKTQQKWNYNKPYGPGSNPVISTPNGAITLIPNFGLEWRF